MRVVLSVCAACAGIIWTCWPLLNWSPLVWRLPPAWGTVVNAAQFVLIALAVVVTAGAHRVAGWGRLRRLLPAAFVAGLLAALMCYRWLLEPAILRRPDIVWMIVLECLGRAVVLLVPSMALAALLASLRPYAGALSPDNGAPQVTRKAAARLVSAVVGVTMGIAAMWGAVTVVRDLGHLRSQLHRADRLMLDEKYSEAVPILEETLRRWPQSYYARERLGWALLDSRRPGEAAEQFRAVLDAQPRYGGAHSGFGESLLWDGRLAEAQREFETAVRLDPAKAHGHLGLGHVLYRKWWEMEGLGSMSRFGHVQRRGPAALHHRELLRESAGHLRRACALDPAQAFCHTNLGDVLLWDGDYAGAVAELREAIRLAPEDSTAWYGLHRGLFLSGDLDGARAALRLPLAAKPPDPYAQACLAEVLEHMGRWAEASAELRAAARQCPERAYIYLAWADTVLRTPGTPRPQDTVRELRELARQPAAAEGAHVAAGMLLLHGGEPAQAAEEFHGALRANPRSAEAHYGLGRVAQAQGDLRKAASALRQALALDAYLYAAHAALADVYSRQGSPAASKAEAALAEGESPDLLVSTRRTGPR